MFDELDHKWPEWKLKERRKKSKERDNIRFDPEPSDKGGKSG